ncbi:hypothetical protein G9A89_001456 [Geosiphon pyriformis]|nr:hypothetical protein G9A89_001456 [Geosiphon pyriformis]
MSLFNDNTQVLAERLSSNFTSSQLTLEDSGISWSKDSRHKEPIFISSGKGFDLKQNTFPIVPVSDPMTLAFLKRMAHVANTPYCSKSDEIGAGSPQIITDAFVDPESQDILIYARGPELTLSQWQSRKCYFTKLRDNPPHLIDTNLHKVIDTPLKDRLIAKVLLLSQLIPKNNVSIVVTGHSIGGAYAMLLAMMILGTIKIQNPFDKYINSITVVTFGQPRIGNDYYAKRLASLMPIFRVTHTNDYVPHFPKKSQSGIKYVHHETEYWIIEDCECYDKTADKKIKNEKNYQVYKCSSAKKASQKAVENMASECNAGTNGIGVNAHHGPYFGVIFGQCDNFF